ncbi:ABC transporter permease subunit [Cohnella abietis]|uniref:Acetoin ABC transporter permease n=1 Tax=Cohnella abietis TaxID=2507935 RepID=A0A3T1DDU9_9BACL|nr:ABC transporter permease subunit [Cohnella abietis]BBI36269.1 acetoin ABC transporter permease [Cohnella abietis]
MWIKSLALREAKQASAILWILPLGHLLTLGLQRYNSWFMGEPEWIDRNVSAVRHTLDAYQYGAFESGSRIWLMIALFVLAFVQVGWERRNGSQELLFSFPYSRSSIFVTKWLFGTGLLIGSLLINTLIDMAIIASSPVSSYFSLAFHVKEVLYTVLSVGAVYSLAMFIGTICGSIASQSVFSLLILILPYSLWTLVQSFLRINNIPINANSYYKIEQYFNPINYVAVDHIQITLKYVMIMGGLLAITVGGGLMAFIRTRTENNGKLLIFRGWERAVQISFVVCFALASGSILSGFFYSQSRLIWYYIGALAGVFLGLNIIRYLTRIRFKI